MLAHLLPLLLLPLTCTSAPPCPDMEDLGFQLSFQHNPCQGKRSPFRLVSFGSRCLEYI